MTNLNELIRSRHSVYPHQFEPDALVSKSVLLELLENANHAPTHRMTEPWRFKVFEGESKEALGEFLATKHEEVNPGAPDSKLTKIKDKCQQSAVVLAIVLHRDPKESVPYWEEVAAVACAVQNFWLGLRPHNLGGYWSSPATAKELYEFIPMDPREECLGFFYLGVIKDQPKGVAKSPIEDKIQWY